MALRSSSAAHSMLGLWLLLGTARAQTHTAQVNEVQPTLHDTVHAIWLNGPAFSAKLPSSAASSWPQFDNALATRAGTKCSARDDEWYTGYDDDGRYCEGASTALDDNALLLLHSGKLGIVVDAGGLKAAASGGTRNLFPKLGALGATQTTAAPPTTPREVYDALASVSTDIKMDVTCGSSVATYVLGMTGDTYVQTGLVRQGHAVTQITLAALQFQDSTTGSIYGPCGSFVSQQQIGADFSAAVNGRRRSLTHISSHHCNQDFGGASHPCPSADFPSCQGFVPGSSWGKCWSVCTASGGHPNLWGELTVWGDSISFDLAWDADFALGAGCSGAVTVSIGGHTRTVTMGSSGRRLDALTGRQKQIRKDDGDDMPTSDASAGDVPDGDVPDYAELDRALHYPKLGDADKPTATRRSLQSSSAAQRRVSMLLIVGADGALADAPAADTHPITVTSSSGRWVRSRPATRDVFVEVPNSVGQCGYNTACRSIPLSLVDMVATNPHPTEHQTLRLSFSRNFHIGDSSLPQTGTGAEITGLSTQLWETSTSMASGIPLQISKNWHVGDTSSYWAGFDGYWWTANALLHLPPNSRIDLSLALNYELYGGLPAWSHAQLSVVGYSDKWLWEQAALGSGGENICFDPLGAHTRAFITDVRPKLFDGKWKENVGGGDFVQLFGGDGKLMYMKAMDPQLHTSGPCLSKAEYNSVTLDESIVSRVTVSGARTDDLVRVFVDVVLSVQRDTNFSRLILFQQTSETYSYRATHQRFVWGGKHADTVTLEQACTAASGGLNLRRSGMLYGSGGLPVRAPMNGTAPWWFAFEGNTDSVTGDMVVGDKGLVIRSFAARLGGVAQPAPSISILCDKLELSTPSALKSLSAGDSVNMTLELLVLPREGAEYNTALRNSWQARGSSTSGRQTLRDNLYGMRTSERVERQALGGEVRVTAVQDARVESHYPVKVAATSSASSGGGPMFTVRSANASKLVAAMGGAWCVGNTASSDGQFCCAASCGSCGDASNCASGGEANSCCTSTIQAPCLTASQHTCIRPSHASVAPVHAAPLGFVPVVISGLATHNVPSGHGLWLKAEGAAAFTRLTQGSGNAFWQTNYDRATGTYEIVYNVEFLAASTTVAFGSDPGAWPSPPSPPLPPPPSPAPVSAVLPVSSPTGPRSIIGPTVACVVSVGVFATYAAAAIVGLVGVSNA